MSQQERIRIRLEAFDHRILNLACQQILDKIHTTQSKIVGPVTLPTKKRIYCVLRSPHVNKDAREHFEIRVHKRILDVYPASIEAAYSLININLPSGVTTTIK
uniref:Small ribosomal subunit protein uS10c n=1 Tax=Rhizochromulina marina TaxID=1034831 RepID=A0A514CPY1_9STRA|nr:ribosomal protein S10 [Rhizochromulina marina]QDH81814.1 ribosomal protein S10 [Rhizochromulina marina]